MPSLKTYDLFISHAWRYNEEYYKLEEMLRQAPFFTWRNYSVPQHDPVLDPNRPSDKQKLAAALDRQIRPVNCVLVLAGMYAAHREWILEEISIAQSYNKPIVGIKPWGQILIPTAVSGVAKEMVGWNTSSIVDAVRRNSL